MGLTVQGQRWMAAARIVACCAGVAIVAGAPPAAAHPQSPDPFPEVHRQIDQLLIAEGLDSENMALLLFSPRRRRYLYRQAIDQPMIAASNAKLATTYAALRLLTPNFRWKTDFFRLTENLGAAGQTGQGLLVRGSGDPSLTAEIMARIALRLKTRGLHRVEGAVHLDDSRFDGVRYPPAWGQAIAGQHWFAPISPFVVDGNAAEFLVYLPEPGAPIEVFAQPAPAFFTLVTRVTAQPVAHPLVRVHERWNGDGARFTLEGRVPDKSGIANVEVAVRNPRELFYHHLRAALRRVGVQGEMPLAREGAAIPGGVEGAELIHAHYSAPLRELLVDINKESSNLAAETLLRAFSLTRRATGASGEEGLALMRRLLADDFPRVADEVALADGSGLSRETRMSARFLVHLLNRVLGRTDFRAEYVASLSIAGWDGTLQHRHYPPEARGRIRAKSGTLAGVQNLTGYLQLHREQVVFSFLINDSERNFGALQAAQDRVLSGVLAVLLAEEAAAAEK